MGDDDVDPSGSEGEGDDVIGRVAACGSGTSVLERRALTERKGFWLDVSARWVILSSFAMDQSSPVPNCGADVSKMFSSVPSPYTRSILNDFEVSVGDETVTRGWYVGTMMDDSVWDASGLGMAAWSLLRKEATM